MNKQNISLKEVNAMKKIQTLYKREFDNHHAITISDTKPISSMEWVEEGKGVATVKVDGACCAIFDGVFYKRYDAKRGKPIPSDAIPCQSEADAVTGHMPCWRPCRRDDPSDKYFWQAFDNTNVKGDGTYEAVGPAWQGNPYGLECNILEPHGASVIEDLTARDFGTIKKYLQEHYIEGIVFWLDGEPKCKIKRSDFGFEWNKRAKKR